MLVLTRNEQEAIMIGDHIQVRILSIKGKQVRIGIDAPKDVAIHREEIYARIQDELKAAKPEDEQ